MTSDGNRPRQKSETSTLIRKEVKEEEVTKVRMTIVETMWVVMTTEMEPP